MSLVAHLTSLATRIGNEIKGLVRPDHPGLARAWVNFGYVSGAVQLRAAYNVASVIRLAKGQYRINFSTPFLDADYCWSALARSSSNTGTQRLAIVRASNEEKTPAYVDVACATSSAALADSTEINVVVFR